MQTKNQISLTRKILYGIMLLGLFFPAFGAWNLSSARALEGAANTPTPEVQVQETTTPVPDVQETTTPTPEVLVQETITPIPEVQETTSPEPEVQVQETITSIPEAQETATPMSEVQAQDVSPTVITIAPLSAFNDLDTPVTITGTDFTADLSGTPPTINLGSVALTNVTLVDSATLTATVPWGVDPGVYTLTVTNPDDGTGSLASAFTVTQGIGQWIGGNLFGGEVRQILMKPDDPNTLYASAYGVVGLFRSQDAAEHWTYVSADIAINNGKFAIDPLHPSWLYGFDYKGLYRSQDEGNTWTKLMSNTWPDGRSMNSSLVFASPHNPQVLFVSSSQNYGNPYSGDAFGLIKSTNGGASWQIVADMEGILAQDVAFHPIDPLKMVLATSDARVFQSVNGGDTWSEVLKPPLSSLGLGGVIAYNPYKPSEVWIVSAAAPGGIYKSTDAAFLSWQNVTPPEGMGASDVKFTSADSVYITKHHSTDGGLTWQWYGPLHGYGEMRFNPDDSQIGYLGDAVYGVQKTTDGGQTWEVKSQGLTGMRCDSMEVSRADPLRVFAKCGPPGIYRSNDGANNWTYLPIPTTNGVHLVHEDPFDAQRLYVVGDGFIVSTDGGENWSNLGWNLPPSSPTGMPWTMEPDPFQAGHVLLGMVSGSYGLGTGWLYSSSDYGVSWQAVTMPQDVAWITDIAFDPETPGLIYLTTGGTGVYRSTDSGMSWERIDDLQQPNMQYVANIAIATHPQHVLFVSAGQGPYRSFDGGATWEKAQNYGGSMFVGGDSTRLYAATGFGLFFSSNVGDSWTVAAGALGQLQIMALGYATMDGHTILYAATNGGSAGTTSSMAADTPLAALAMGSNLVEAGIYRYVQVPKSKTFYSSGAQDGWVLETGETTSKGGTMNSTATTFRLGDDKAKKQYRGILSFSTKGLPDTAVIIKVTLRVRKQSITGGGNPITTFQGFVADIKKGYFGTTALQTADFQTAASKTYGPFKPALSGSWYSIDLTGGKAYINKLSSYSGLTQIRLRFKLDDNNNTTANYLSLYSGNASSSYRPQLVIEYYVP
jgi:photosystem II stability/assembly factor-like uncharacterized protein